MNIKLIVVEKAIKWLVGGDLLKFIKEAVAEINDANVSGEDKRLAVQMMAKEFFSNSGVIFVNIAIEIAVLLLKAQLTEED